MITWLRRFHLIEKPENLLRNKSTEGDERMYCWNCGAENEDEARFCWKCGANLQEQDELPESLTEPEETEKSSKAPLIIAITACIILCVVIAGAVVSYWYLTTTDEAANDSQGKVENGVSEANGIDDAGEENEDTDDEDTHAVDAVVDEIVDQWNDSSKFIMSSDCVKYSEDTRIDYYDKEGKAVRFSQKKDNVTLTYLFDDDENIVYISEKGSDNSYAYYYYQEGDLICYSKNMTRNYVPFDEAVKSSSAEYFRNGLSLLADCLIDKEDSELDNEETESNQDYILPDSSSRILSDSEVSVLSKEELRLARNEIYARHGRKFDDVQLQSYFDSKSWYKGTIDPADFSESMLSEIEKKNIELIKKYE